MANTFKLEILTPTGKYLSQDVDFVEVQTQEYLLGILPNHSPLISTIVISKLTVKSFGETYLYAVGGGVLRVEKETTTLMLESIERVDEIDINRAYEAKKRAEDRLTNSNEEIDILRAELALSRALNRIRIVENNQQ